MKRETSSLDSTTAGHSSIATIWHNSDHALCEGRACEDFTIFSVSFILLSLVLFFPSTQKRVRRAGEGKE